MLLLLILLVTIVLPYGDYDAMGDGTWSRFMGIHLPTYHFPGIGAMEYQRPVFFVLQGIVWRLFGYHMYLGRLTSFSFALLLIGTIAWLAAGVARPYRWLAATLAIVVLLTVTPFERYVSAGMTDVPVAAMVALTAAVLRRAQARACAPAAARGRRDAHRADETVRGAGTCRTRRGGSRWPARRAPKTCVRMCCPRRGLPHCARVRLEPGAISARRTSGLPHGRDDRRL